MTPLASPQVLFQCSAFRLFHSLHSYWHVPELCACSFGDVPLPHSHLPLRFPVPHALPALGLLQYTTAAPRLQRRLPSGKGFLSGPFYDEANLQLPRTVAATPAPNWIHKVDK